MPLVACAWPRVPFTVPLHRGNAGPGTNDECPASRNIRERVQNGTHTGTVLVRGRDEESKHTPLGWSEGMVFGF